jgi:hypothetical protein
MIFMPDAKTSRNAVETDENRKARIILGDSLEAFGGTEPSVTCPRAT